MVTAGTSPAGSVGRWLLPFRLAAGAAGVSSLALGLWLGLVRLGFEWPVPSDAAGAVHGSLMVCGFLGTVICIERATALRNPVAWLGPLAGAAGAVLLVLSVLESPVVGPRVARVAFLVESAVLAAVSLAVLRKQPELFNVVAVAAAGVFVTANALLFAGKPLFVVVPWWAGFVVVTIAAERLELSRVTRPSRTAVGLFVAILAALVAALVLLTFRYADGLRALGAALVLLAAWLLRCDIARRTVRLAGLTRYIALGLLSGYGWLALAGTLALAGRAGGLGRDAFYHALFLGFAMSMIFAHAPVILPAVTGLQVAWTRAFYLPLAALHASLAARVYADLAADTVTRSWAGLTNALTVAAFFAVLASGVLRARLSATSR